VRKLVIAVVAILAIFTFIREYDADAANAETRKAELPSELISLE